MNIKVHQYPYAKNNALPKCATIGSAGMDLYAANQEEITIMPGERALIPTGIAIVMPDAIDGYKYEAQIRSRSGLALNHGIVVLNSPGTIDQDYHEEIGVILMNHDAQKSFTVIQGMKIAQIVFAKCEIVKFEEITESEMSEYKKRGGFGSSGVF